MRRKSVLVIGIAIAAFAGGFICLKLLFNANPYSTSYRNRNRTEVTLHLLASSLDFYQVQYGSFPTGDNAAILRKLCGDNADKMVFFEPPSTYSPSTWPPHIEKDLDLRVVDGWNTPIRFNFGPNSRVESAGEDKRFDTADDIVVSLH